MKTPSFRIVPERHEVYVGKKEVLLAPKEFDILSILSQDGGTVSREEIMTRIWPNGTVSEPRTVDQHIARLRYKLRPAEVVLTVPGRGYKIALA